MRTMNAPADDTRAATRRRIGEIGLRSAASVAALAMLAACVPSSSSPNVPDRLGRVSGQVAGLDGAPVSGARIAAAGREARTDAAGRFVIDEVAPAERLAVSIAGDGFVPTVAAYRVEAGSESNRNIVLIPQAQALRLDASRGGEVPVGPDGRLVLPGGALVDESGQPVQGEVLVRATYIDPADPRQVAAAPGDYRTGPEPDSMTQLETFGMVQVTFASPAGRALRLAEGRTAQLQWPRGRQAGDVRGNLYALSPTGLWVTRMPIEPMVTIRDSTVWNWDYQYTSTCIEVDIGAPVAGISVKGTGVNYSGSATAYTNAQGKAFLAVRPASVVDVSFTAPGTSTSTVRVNTPGPGLELPPCRQRERTGRPGSVVAQLQFNEARVTTRVVDAITPIRVR
jgi:hypothetical protein